MIDYNVALAKVNEHLGKSEMALQVTSCDEFPVGWLFYYQTKEYLETGDPSSLLAGNGPMLIDRETGDLLILVTYRPVEVQIEEYARRRGHAIGG
ncbi:YrhB domain-containing protein [Luteibacter yeojuensis]|uniref:Immunity protein 35 domain-containing protein n=1 Tax=Luteibacter yeojuensis TaxID=345309 RepID=A0A7X5QXY5_9GAMM|nr:YrhB domain-containing protein [Luteibacter yeojuensis]NID17385.1 hypothetical protein [Luteibacter yeojuensis]